MDTLDTLDTLLAVRELLDNPDNWTTKYFARNRQGNAINPLADEARCWCLLGAWQKVRQEVSINQTSAAGIALFPVLQASTSWFNDNHSHAYVMRALDRAISYHAMQSMQPANVRG